MRHPLAMHRRCIVEDLLAQWCARLQSDPLVHGGLALVPPVVLFGVLHGHAHIGWDACVAAMRQLESEHGRHMRELSTALSLLKSLRGSRAFDPLAWHAVTLRLTHALTRHEISASVATLFKWP